MFTNPFNLPFQNHQWTQHIQSNVSDQELPLAMGVSGWSNSMTPATTYRRSYSNPNEPCMPNIHSNQPISGQVIIYVDQLYIKL